MNTEALSICRGVAGRKRKRITLKTPSDAIVVLHQIANGVWNDDLDPGKARVLIYCAQVMITAFEKIELGERLAALEAKQKERGL